MTMKTEFEKGWDNFKETYLEGSSIKQVIFDNETQKWIITYDYNVPDDEFNSLSSLIDFCNSDQFGDY